MLVGAELTVDHPPPDSDEDGGCWDDDGGGGGGAAICVGAPSRVVQPPVRKVGV
jgi:hypothetical protein